MVFLVKYRYWFVSLVDGWHIKKSIKKIYSIGGDKLLVSFVKCRRIYLWNFSMHKNTISYTKLRRLSCVDLCTQGPCGWLRGTWNLWRVWWDNEHVLRFSMVEGYMVYQNMLYVSEYLPNLASKLNLHHICDPDSNNKFEGEQLKGKCRSRKLKGNY